MPGGRASLCRVYAERHSVLPGDTVIPAAFWPITGVCHLTQKGDPDRTFPTFFSQLIPSIPTLLPALLTLMPDSGCLRLEGGGVGEQLSKA